MKILQGFVAPYALEHDVTVGFGPGGSTAPSVRSALLEDHAAARPRLRAKAAPAADRWAPRPEPTIETCSIPSATTTTCRIWLDTAYCRRIGDIFLLSTLVWKLDQPRRLDSAGCYRTVRFACRGGHPSSKGVPRLSLALVASPSPREDRPSSERRGPVSTNSTLRPVF